MQEVRPFRLIDELCLRDRPGLSESFRERLIGSWRSNRLRIRIEFYSLQTEEIISVVRPLRQQRDTD